MKIAGVIPALTTPFDEMERVDTTAFEQDVRFMVEEARVHGICVGGSTGEGHTLATDELRTLVATAQKVSDNRIPVLAGVLVDSTAAAIDRGKALADLNVAALLVTPVHYVFSTDDDSNLKFFADIADATGIPVMIYNVIRWNRLEAPIVARIVNSVEGVIGVKQAMDLNLLADLLPLMPDEGVVMSANAPLLLPSFVLGVDGCIANMAALTPTLYVEMWEAVQREDLARGRELHEILLPVCHAVQAGPGNSAPAAIKYGMQLQGRDSGYPRAPMPFPDQARRTAIRSALAGAGLVADESGPAPAYGKA
jgi:4-hydroxy-tetrahydrodipicolinate synthase